MHILHSYMFLGSFFNAYRYRAQSCKRNHKAWYRCPSSLGGKFGKRNRGHRYRFIWVRLPILCLAVSFTWLRSKCIPSYSNQLFKRIFSFAYGYGLEKHTNVFSKIPYKYNSWKLIQIKKNQSGVSSDTLCVRSPELKKIFKVTI